MTHPDIVRCPDDHFRRAFFGLGPVIADYPEQVILTGIVSGWCPKYFLLFALLFVFLLGYRCLAFPYELDRLGEARDPEYSDKLADLWDPGILWTNWGIDAGVTVSTVTVIS
jgi:hypothetical protein